MDCPEDCNTFGNVIQYRNDGGPSYIQVEKLCFKLELDLRSGKLIQMLKE